MSGAGVRQARKPASGAAAARYYGEESTLIELSPVRCLFDWFCSLLKESGSL
jgi:hypothetical protein